MDDEEHPDEEYVPIIHLEADEGFDSVTVEHGATKTLLAFWGLDASAYTEVALLDPERRKLIEVLLKTGEKVIWKP